MPQIELHLSKDELDTLETEGVEGLVAKLRSSMDRLSGRATAIRNQANLGGRDMTADEARSVDRILASFQECDDKFQALVRDDDCGPCRIVNIPARPRQVPPRMPQRNPYAPNSGGYYMQQHAVVPYSGGARFADMFPNTRAPQQVGGFSSFGEFAMLTLTDPMNPRLRNESMSEGNSVSAGFTVPTQFIQTLLDRSLENEIVRSRATVLPFETNSAAIPSFNYQDGTGGLRAGLELRWVAELGVNTPQKAKTRNINMRILKGAIYVNASAELTEDAPLFSRRLETAMSDAISVGLDHSWLFGSGTGGPLGVINSAGTISVAKEGSQTADTITENNILAMASRLSPNSWRNAIWMASPTALGQLYKLSQATGPNAGARTVLLREGDGGLTLMTKPLLITDACAPLGDNGDIVLADWSRYLIGLRKQASLETSIHAGWLTDEVGFRMILRMNGLPEMEAPTKLRDGTNTVAHFITLDARA